MQENLRINEFGCPILQWLNYKIIWNKAVSSKVFLFAWIVFNKRILMKDDFFPSWCGASRWYDLLWRLWDGWINESCFLGCSFFDSIWQSIRRWLGISSIYSADALEHVIQFGDSGVFRKEICFSLQVIWWATMRSHPLICLRYITL